MSPATRGLSAEDVESIRGTLAAGRRPKVVFTESAGQIVGQFGQVVELTDPAAGEDYLVVRFGRDQLPFSPADLAIPARGAGPAKSTNGTGPRSSAPRSAEPAGPPPLPSPREEQDPMPTAKAAAAPAAAKPATEAKPAEQPVVPAEPAAVPAAKKATKAGRPKPPPGLTVTLAYTEGEWTVAAQQGTKALAKPYVIKPAEALKMVSMLDVSGVQEAVEAILANERAEAQHQAQRLRAELAEIEAKLAELGTGA